MPTDREQEAYKWVMISGMKTKQAAKVMGITTRRVNQLLSQLNKKYPHLFGGRPFHLTQKKPYRFSEDKDSEPKIIF